MEEIRRVARHSDFTGLERMVKLAMTALLPDLNPSVLLDQSDYLPKPSRSQ
jgi:hypothetical protein